MRILERVLNIFLVFFESICLPSIILQKERNCFKKLVNKYKLFAVIYYILGFPSGVGGKEPTYQCRKPKRLSFDPWVRKIP